MKKPTQILSDEHKNILCVINGILKECGKIDAGEELDRRNLITSLDGIN